MHRRRFLATLSTVFAIICFFTPTGYAMSNPIVEMKTNYGTVTMELFADKAPKTVENFLRYVDEQFYDETIFHRVIDGFMIQGGGFDVTFNQKSTHAPIENEATNGVANAEGTIAMARTGDPHSATAQFFINLKNNTFLNHTGKNPHGWGYAVFGKVTDGMDVVNTIKGVDTGVRSMHADVPKQDVLIEHIRRVN